MSYPVYVQPDMSYPFQGEHQKYTSLHLNQYAALPQRLPLMDYYNAQAYPQPQNLLVGVNLNTQVSPQPEERVSPLGVSPLAASMKPQLPAQGQFQLPHPQHLLLYLAVPLMMNQATFLPRSQMVQPAAHAHTSPTSPELHELSESGSTHGLINYLLLVSYTVLPASKRRRRADMKHLSVLKHTCDKCGKLFQKPYNLKSHMKTHSTERPYQCLVCSKTFARLHDRKRHELLHEGVKNFKCEGFLKDGSTKWGCGKKFARLDALARHFRTETGWLCIKPLMDEAKELELQGKPVDLLAYLPHQILLPPLRPQY